MPFISCPNAAVAVIHATQLGKPIANVLNFQFTAPYTQSNLDPLALVCDANVGGSYLPLIAPSVTYDRVDVRGLTFASHTRTQGRAQVHGRKYRQTVRTAS